MKINKTREDGTIETVVVKTNVGRDLTEVAKVVGCFLLGIVLAVLMSVF